MSMNRGCTRIVENVTAVITELLTALTGACHRSPHYGATSNALSPRWRLAGTQAVWAALQDPRPNCSKFRLTAM